MRIHSGSLLHSEEKHCPFYQLNREERETNMLRSPNSDFTAQRSYFIWSIISSRNQIHSCANFEMKTYCLKPFLKHFRMPRYLSTTVNDSMLTSTTRVEEKGRPLYCRNAGGTIQTEYSVNRTL